MKACINLDTNEVMVELNDGDKFGSGKVYIGSSIIIRGKFSDKEIDDIICEMKIKGRFCEN